LNVLHILAPGEVGGLERVVEALAAGQAASGHEVAVAAILDAPTTEHPLLDGLRRAGVDTRVCSVPARAYRSERRAVTSLIAELGPDVVHTHGYRPDVVDSGVARRLGVPVVTTVHGFTGGGLRNRAYEWLQRRAFRRFDAVVAVSRPLGEALVRAGVPAAGVHVLRNAWCGGAPHLSRDDARAALGIEPDRFHLGWVGRASAEKGLDVFVDALPFLDDLPIVASVIGDGRELGPLRDRAAALGVADRVRWHGIVNDAGRLFAGFEVFVLSSRTEGTPVVLFEAMAAGVPVVATAVGGVPDVVGHEEALLVPPDRPRALADSIRDVLTDPAASARRTAAASVRLASEFGAGPWLAAYDEIYREAGAGAGARATLERLS
jgi:glycosyltransferase involved in cell wall biosynthesis